MDSKSYYRFLEMYEPDPYTGCWNWTESTAPNGYGRMSYNGTTDYAHRLSWNAHFGVIPDGLHVLHRCDNPTCVNPEHLFLGTHQDNMDDMMRKGRRGNTGGHWKVKRLLKEGLC